MTSSLTKYVKRMTNSIVASGVKHVVISPGSRSTPLAYAFASHPHIQVHIQVDERSAGFLGLGLAKQFKEPVALLCTSGTAASNYMPAITEAHYARVPLIVLTADRPHELREVGAPQTIDQVKMYGDFVKASIDFPLAEELEASYRFVERQSVRLIQTATTHPMGPVHFNIPFREPLLIDFDLDVPSLSYERQMVGNVTVTEEQKQMLEEMRQEERGMIVVGELEMPIEKERFWQFARQLGWPVLVDPISQLRTEVPDDVMCIEQYDALLKNESYQQEVRPDYILRIGAQPTSKPLNQFIAKSDARLITIDASPHFRDFTAMTAIHWQMPTDALFSWESTNMPVRPYAKRWIEANAIAQKHVRAYAGNDEGAYVKALAEHIPTGDVLFSSSSMPIRDLDTFFLQTDRDIPILANRGANGIDGVVSTAIGVQRRAERHTWLLIGDLAFLHDVNGLLATRYGEVDLTIVVINNDGGGIFSYLPQSTVAAHYEQLFGTPTNLKFEHIAHLYEAQYDYVDTAEDFVQALQAEKTKPLRIIEVATNRFDNVARHRQLWAAINDEVNGK